LGREGSGERNTNSSPRGENSPNPSARPGAAPLVHPWCTHAVTGTVTITVTATSPSPSHRHSHSHRRSHSHSHSMGKAQQRCQCQAHSCRHMVPPCGGETCLTTSQHASSSTVMLVCMLFCSVSGTALLPATASGPAPGAGAAGTPVVSVDLMIQEDPSTATLLDERQSWHYRDPQGVVAPFAMRRLLGWFAESRFPPSLAVWRGGGSPRAPPGCALRIYRRGRVNPWRPSGDPPPLAGAPVPPRPIPPPAPLSPARKCPQCSHSTPCHFPPPGLSPGRIQQGCTGGAPGGH